MFLIAYFNLNELVKVYSAKYLLGNVLVKECNTVNYPGSHTIKVWLNLNLINDKNRCKSS